MDHDDEVTVVERHLPLGVKGWRKRPRFGGKHGTLVGVAIVVSLIGFWVLMAWSVGRMLPPSITGQ